MSMNPNELQQQTDTFEMTEKHIAIVVNQILTLMSSSMQGATNAFNAQKSLDPLVNAFTALHGGMVQSRQARATQQDPQAQLELEKMKIQHQHALDIMGQHHEEQVSKSKLQLEQQAHEHKLMLAEQKAKAEEERAGLQNAQIVKQIQQQEEVHQQQQQHAQQNQEQTLSNTDEMHQVQVQQAKSTPTE